MLISVVIPSFNRAVPVVQAIESVLAQSYEEYEIAIVDDGSTDDTSERVLPFLRDKRVRYFRQRNAGAGAARNQGIAMSSGDAIAFLDSDDLWKPDKLARDVDFLSKHPEADAVFSDVEKYDGAIHMVSMLKKSRVFHRFIRALGDGETVVFTQREMFLCLLKELPIKTPALSVRRYVFDEVGVFDPSIVSGQDWELFLRIARRYRYGYINSQLATVRTSSDSLHLVGGPRGLTQTWRLLSREKRSATDDIEVRDAANEGISYCARRIGWHALDRGDRWGALRVHLQGFRDTGDVSLLLRALADLLPGRLH